MQDTTLLKRGLTFAAQGDLQHALELFKQAVVENPNDSKSYNCLGAVQYNMRLFAEAESSLSRALELNPKNPDALCNLGALFISTHCPGKAKLYLEQVIQIQPNYSAAYNNLGFILMQEERYVESEFLLRRAIELRPDYPSAYNNLGMVQAKRLLPAEAEVSFCRAIQQQPKFPEAYNNLGILLKGSNHLEEAAKCLYSAIQLNPRFAEAYNNLGTVLTDADHVDLAESCFYRAIRSNPDYPEPYHNLGVLFTNSHRLDEAEAHFVKALDLNPNYTEAEFSLATLYLLQGRYKKGWEKYDKSRMIKHSVLPNVSRWKGEILAGKRILLYHEQGFGDTFHFIRYAQLVDPLAAKTILWVQKPLQRLIAASFPAIKVYCTETMPPGKFDFSCPFPSLPKLFNTARETIPHPVPYIKPPDEMIRRWDNRIGKLARDNFFRVGVVWAGNPEHHNDRDRSISFAEFSRLLELPAVTWISLQAGERSRDVNPVSDKVLDFSDQLTDFAKTAGIIANVDLVISVDSAVAHLAGAMGKPTWLLLPFAPDWRWQLKRDDSPWYPTMRLFRQRKARDWPEVLARVKKALQLKIDAGKTRTNQ